MNLQPRILCVLAVASLAALSGCDEAQEKVKHSESPAASVPVENQEPTFDDLNTTLFATFPSPERIQPALALDILQPETAFGLYNSLRTWEEDGKDLANLLKSSLGEGGVPVFKLGREYSNTSDEFKKHDLEVKILAETLHEAAKVEGNRLVKFLSEPGKPVSLDVGKYNFEENTFKIDHCLFSDKIEYSKEERRYAQNLKGSDQERCYFRTTNTELKVGFTGGSKVIFKIEDLDLARKIEGQRKKLKVAVYGYVESVRREKVGGNLVKERFVLIAPQRVELIDAHGQVLAESTI